MKRFREYKRNFKFINCRSNQIRLHFNELEISLIITIVVKLNKISLSELKISRITTIVVKTKYDFIQRSRNIEITTIK